jgi:hypothetical protein
VGVCIADQSFALARHQCEGGKDFVSGTSIYVCSLYISNSFQTLHRAGVSALDRMQQFLNCLDITLQNGGMQL